MSVLQIAFQNTVFNQDGTLCGIALIIHIQGATAVFQGAIVNDGHALGRHALANTTREQAAATTVKVPFQTVAHGFVQHDPWPTWAQNHRHLTGRRRFGFQIRHGRTHGLIHVAAQHIVGEVGQINPSTTCRRAAFTAAILFNNDRQGQMHQGAYIGGQTTIATGHQHDIVFRTQTGHDLHHARVRCTSQGIQSPQQGYFLRSRQAGNRVCARIQGGALRVGWHQNAAFA